MKATELRIGNLVGIASELNFKIGKVTLISYNRILLDGKISSKNNKFIPIPLTEEWLLKFGFDKSIKMSYSTGVEVPFNVYKKSILTYNSIQNCWWVNDLILKMQPEYVHELQNLYFMLAGQELTLNEKL